MGDESPLVCICVPTYNAESTVRETLESILSQTYPNLVVRVSDNASTDNTLSIVASISDSRISIHRHNENVGGEGNFNRCIQLAEGKYTAIFHADDVYEPEMIAKQVAFMETHPEAGAVFTEANTIDDTGRRIGELRLPRHIASTSGLYDFVTMFKAVLCYSNFFICPSAMARTEIYQQEIKGWRGELFKSSADLDLWLRILQRHPVGYLGERLMNYRISGNQGSARVRQGTERADFFLVTDYYLKQESIRALLASDDFRNSRWLERRDRVMRAVNHVLIGQPEQAKALLTDIPSFDALHAAIKSRRGLFVLLIGVYVKLITAMGLYGIGCGLLRYMKQVTGK